MSDSEDDPVPSMANADYSDNDGPSTSWGFKRRNKCPVISDSENDDEDDLGEEIMKDDGESGDSDSSEDTPGAKTCAICLGHMRGEVGSPDACEHTFCKFCLLEWAKNNPTCPQDRIPFTLVLVRKMLGKPIYKELPIPKGPAPDVYEFVEVENPTYCEVCNQCDREESLLLCDGCDLGYHLECLDPPLAQVPAEEWFCPVCVAVDVPETLSHRLSSSNRHSRTRRSTSRSERAPQDQQELRIPRTRATELIRQRIQKKKHKKKLKRKKNKERKKARISSGEIEDDRKPVTQFAEFKYFVEGDNDIDAEHTEDRYADQLLAGTTHESARFPAQRKADAARRLRDMAFTPHVSYAGRVKNKVLEVVSIQSEETANDLLSGILENQAIAFSSSKKLLLTSDRKLVKQPDAEFSCDIVQETTSLMTEPLPSQRKSPEIQCVASSSTENSSLEIPKEHNEQDLINKEQTTSSERQMNPSKPADYHSSRREDHRKSRYAHHSSRYSHHDRHSSSRRNHRHYEPSCSYASHERSYTSHRWKEKRDYKDYHDRHTSHDKSHSRDVSPHRRSRSPWRERRRDRSPGFSSRHGRSYDKKTHSSQSKSKRESSHSSNRSQWSYNYFNANDSIINKTSNISKNHSVTAGIEVLSNEKRHETAREENNVNIKVSEEVPEVNGRHSLIDKFQKQNASKEKTYSEVKADMQNESLDNASEVLLSLPKKCLDDIEQPNGKVELMLKGTNAEMPSTHFYHKDQNKGYDCKTSVSSFLESPITLGKKAKMSALFGDMKGEEKVGKISKEGKKKSEMEVIPQGNNLNYSRVSKKSKSEVLFGYDSDDNLDLDIVLTNNIAVGDQRTEQKLSKMLFDEEGNMDSHSRNLTNVANGYEAEEYDPIKNTHVSTDKGMESKLCKSNKYLENNSTAASKNRPNNKAEVIDGEESNKETKKCSKMKEKEKENQSKIYDITSDELQNEVKGHEKFDNKNEPDPVCDKYSTKEYKFKLDDRNAADELNSDLHKKDLETRNGRNPKIKSQTSLRNEKSKTNEKGINANEKTIYTVKESAMISKSVTEERGEKYCISSSNRKEMDGIERHCTKNIQLNEDLEKKRKETKIHVRNRKEVDIPDKYKEKLSHLEKLIDIGNGTEFWENHTFGDEDVAKVEGSKNNGVGRKSSFKNLFMYDKRNEANKESVTCKVDDRKADCVSGHSKHKNAIQEIGHTVGLPLKTNMEKTKFSQRKTKRASQIVSDLFGDIDDIGSSSCSNIPDVESKQQTAGSDVCSRLSAKDENKCLSFEGKIQKPKDLHETTHDISINNSNSVLDEKDASDDDDEGLTMYRCTPVSKDKSSSFSRKDTGFRIKQQKAILEARVVEVVKKSLDPFYRNKSITKDEYKQIVAKCVKKVVSAECGDVIEPEKMHALVLGYVKVYRHRQSKLHI